MNVTKEKIENFVDEVIRKKDYPLLDILWTFSYSTQETSMSGYWEGKEIRDTFKIWLGVVCERNLTIKYGLNSSQVKGKIKILINFLNSVPDFLSRETFDDDRILLGEILIEKSSKILVQNNRDKLHDLSDLDKNILLFVLNYIPIRIQDSIKKADYDRQRENGYDCGKFGYFPDLDIIMNKETDDIVYFKIDPEGWTYWTYSFNILFDEELGYERVRVKLHRKSVGIIPLPLKQYEEKSFWEFGDELVKIGVGYWVLYVSSGGDIKIKFIISNFIYEDIRTYKDKLPIIENFELTQY